MLTKLLIKNIALIDNAEINFDKGLNVLSGETGSGKSVIIEALNFVLGAKADKTLIRSGENECFVSAVFNVENNKQIQAIFEEFDFEIEDELIISRKFNVDGKTNIKINGNSVTVSMLRKFTALLVDVHGQSEHFYLLKKSNQLDLIDAFCEQEGFELKAKVIDKYKQLKINQKEIDSLGGDENARLVRLDILNYQINEITKADLHEGEEEELLELRKKLANHEKISYALNSVKASITDEGGANDILSNALKILSNVSNLDENYSVLYEKLSNLLTDLDEVADNSSDYLDQLDSFDFDPNYVEERLDLIKSLKRKYGDSIEKIKEFLDNALLEKEKLENFNQTNKKLIENDIKLKKELHSLYTELSDLRRSKSKIFSKNVLAELKDLGMEKSLFEIQFNDKPLINDCSFNSPNGFDDVEFTFSANLGEPLKPLSAIISGGEASRFMLAIKTQTSKINSVSTFVFDEIDAGISGRVAKIVAEKFAKIAKNTQIIAITHLPQISAMADNNLLINKIEIDGKTKTQVKKLTSDKKILEIIRLVGGEISSDAAKNHAIELILEANSYKSKI